MELEPTSEVVYQGICSLYNNPDAKKKQEAAKWLEEFQKSIYSWSIADELLQQKRDMQSCYFAAQTIRNKIQNSFHELPVHVHERLRDSLIAHIGQITNETDAVIVTQLCLAVADLMLLMASWKNPIPQLIENLSSSADSIWPLLEILQFLPEEMDSRYLRLGANRRDEVHREMESNSKTLLDFLNMCLHTYAGQNLNIMNKIIKCFNAWVTINVIPFHHIIDNVITQQVFALLNNHSTSKKLHDAATDCLCTIVQSLESNNNQYTNHQMWELQIFNGIQSLESCYHACVALEDIDKAVNYCRIFTVLGESLLPKMVSEKEAPHYSIKVLDLVLICIGHYDYEIAEITFNLWYCLSEELYQKNDDQLSVHFRPHIERLIGALFRHAQMEPDHEGLIEEDDSFSDFRRKVSELIKDVVFIIGSTNCFKQMFLILQQPSVTWESSESALFIMQNVAKNILPDENEVVPKVVEAILNLPENTHIAFRYTSILLIGELCEWIEAHPQSLQAVLNFLLYSLQQKNGLASAAARALTSICSTCRQHMTCHITGLVEIARSLDSFEISNELAIGLLKGISIIISRLPRPQLESTMCEIITFQFTPLIQLIEAGGSTVTSKEDRTNPIYWLDRACAIIRHTDPDVQPNEVHPTVKILTETWPVISNVLDKYQTDTRIMERTCRLLRYGFRMVGKQASHLLEPLVKQMVCLYAVNHHSCFLYLGSILVDEFAKNDDCTTGLLEMLQAFIEPTFNMLQVENGLKNNPDTVEDFFRLCSRFIEGCPVPFLQSPLVTPIIQCALLACTLDHRYANSAVMKFFCNLLKCGKSNKYDEVTQHLTLQIIKQNGEALVMNLLYASVFCLHSYMLPDVAEVMVELKNVDKEGFERYLQTALDALPKKNSGGCVTATQGQLEDFSTAVLGADATKAVTVALKDFTRLYR
ncbi:unnamed protein product [Hermetia illucens]|uniref:Transportin-3 n=1 Tax=Hermetia illucens TaxID=343691 RepID=A0A7R8UGA8_HERIL|nr:transportin-3 [Hermetia illucens]CAD7080059.1 unnamed protein product [Hermetia illucens]